jgi:hypothetical protein
MFFLQFLLDFLKKSRSVLSLTNGSGSGRLQKHVDPTDPDPQHCEELFVFLIAVAQRSVYHEGPGLRFVRRNYSKYLQLAAGLKIKLPLLYLVEQHPELVQVQKLHFMLSEFRHR